MAKAQAIMRALRALLREGAGPGLKKTAPQSIGGVAGPRAPVSVREPFAKTEAALTSPGRYAEARGMTPTHMGKPDGRKFSLGDPKFGGGPTVTHRGRSAGGGEIYDYRFGEVGDGGVLSVNQLPDRWIIQSSDLSPNLRGQGLGLKMYEDIIRRAAEAGVPTVRSGSEVSGSAQRVYDSLARRYPVREVPGVFGRNFEVSTGGGEPLVGGTPEALARAREQGWNVDEPYYRGMTQPLEGENFRPAEMGIDGPGVYMSKDTYEASIFGSAKDGGAVYPVFTRGKIATDSPTAARERGDAGYRRGNNAVIFDPKNIRSRFAAFDPAKKDSSDLLAAVPVVAGLAAASGQKKKKRKGYADPISVLN